jgi:hypothetical protein
MSFDTDNTESPPSKRHIRLLDVVAVIVDLPEHGLVRGHVGTVVEPLGDDVFDVEFSDDDGRAYAIAALRADQLIPLYHRPVQAV